MASWSSGDEHEQGASRGEGSHEECCTSRSQDLKKVRAHGGTHTRSVLHQQIAGPQKGIALLPACSVQVQGLWTPEEDAILTHCVHRFKEGNWSTIAHKSGLKRSGKSCRLRWVKHLSPTVNTGPLTEEEQGRVIEMQRQYGNKWALIAQFMPGRSDNTIKNFWNSFRKRMERRRNAAYLSASALAPGSPAASLVIRGPPSSSTWPGDAPESTDANALPLAGPTPQPPEDGAPEEDAEAAVSSSAPSAPRESHSLPSAAPAVPHTASRSSAIVPASYPRGHGKPLEECSPGALSAPDMQRTGREAEGQWGAGSFHLGAESEEALGSSPSGMAVDSHWHRSAVPARRPPRGPPHESAVKAGQGQEGADMGGGAEWQARTGGSGGTPFESAEGCVILPQVQCPGDSSHGAAESTPVQAQGPEGSPGLGRPISSAPLAHPSPLSLPRSGSGSGPFRRSSHSPLMPPRLQAALPATATSPLAGTPSASTPVQLPMLLPNEQCMGRGVHKKGSPPLPPAASRTTLMRSPGRRSAAPASCASLVRSPAGAPPPCPRHPQPQALAQAQGASGSGASPSPESALSTAAAVSPQPAPTPTSRPASGMGTQQHSGAGRLVQQNLSSAFSSTSRARAPWDGTLLGRPSAGEGGPRAGDCQPVTLSLPPPVAEQVQEMLSSQMQQLQGALGSQAGSRPGSGPPATPPGCAAAEGQGVSLWTADAGIPDPVLAKKLGQLRDAKKLWDSIMDSPRGMCQALRMSMPSSLRHMPALGASPLAPSPTPEPPAAQAPAPAAQQQQQQQEEHPEQGAGKGCFQASHKEHKGGVESKGFSGDTLSDPTLLFPTPSGNQAAPERGGLPVVKKEHRCLQDLQRHGPTAPATDALTSGDGCPEGFGSPQLQPPAIASSVGDEEGGASRSVGAKEGADGGMLEPKARWSTQLSSFDPAGAPTAPRAAGQEGVEPAGEEEVELAGPNSSAMEKEDVDGGRTGDPGSAPSKRGLGEEEGEALGGKKRVRRESSFRNRQPASLSITRPALAAAALAGVRVLAGAAEEQRRGGGSRCASPLTALGLTDSCRTPDALLAFRGLQSPLATSSLFSSPQCAGEPFWVWDAMGGGHLNSSPSPTPFTPRMAQLATTP